MPNRIQIPEYAMMLAHAAAMRSEDPFRKVGAVAYAAVHAGAEVAVSLLEREAASKELELVQMQAQDAQWEAALERFLEIVRTDRKFRDDGGKAAMLDLFRLLGDEHPLTLEYRSALTMVLF